MPVRMPEDIINEKARLRKRILKERDAVSEGQRAVWDRQILKRLIQYDREGPCAVYLCYVNYRSEVSTKEFILWCFEEGKAVFVPKVLAGKSAVSEAKGGIFEKGPKSPAEMEFYRIVRWEDLKAGYQGILEPEALPGRAFFEWIKQETARKENPRCRMLLPGAVFDRTGNRIGYGGGFYDRWLAKWDGGENGRLKVPEKIGLAYDIQITDKIPAEPFDQKADLIMTESQTIQEETI